MNVTDLHQTFFYDLSVFPFKIIDCRLFISCFQSQVRHTFKDRAYFVIRFHSFPFHPTSVHCNPLIPTVDCRQVVQHCRKMISVPSTNYFRFSWQIIRTRERKFGSILVIVALNWQRGYGHGILYDRSISVLTQANWIVKIIQSVNNIPIRIRRL